MKIDAIVLHQVREPLTVEQVDLQDPKISVSVTESERLYRSAQDHLVASRCGGVAEQSR